MKVMRFANRRGRSHFTLESLIAEKDYSKLQYDLIEDESLRSNQIDFQSLIPECYLQKMDAEEEETVNEKCELFKPVFTDMGMCYSYNAIPVLDILKPTYYTKSFQEVFQDDLMPNDSIHMGVDKGDDLTFYLYGNFQRKIALHLDMGTMEIQKPTNFLFGISNMHEYFGMKSSRKLIQGGYKVTWKVQAMEIIPSEDLRSLPLTSRQCRFIDEYENLDLFRFYTSTACDFERGLKRAQNVCKCTPWYIPSSSHERYSICDLYGNLCFKSFMKKNVTEDSSECLTNCHEIQFTSSEVLEKLDPEDFCDARLFSDDNSATDAVSESNEGAMMKKVKTFLQNSTLVGKISKMRKYGNVTFDGFKRELCIELVTKDLAKVTVMFERLKYLKTSTSLRMTTPDKLGAFGKNKN